MIRHGSTWSVAEGVVAPSFRSHGISFHELSDCKRASDTTLNHAPSTVGVKLSTLTNVLFSKQFQPQLNTPNIGASVLSARR